MKNLANPLSGCISPPSRDDSDALSLKEDWIRKGPVEKMVAALAVIALILTLVPTVDLIFREKEVTFQSFALQNAFLIIFFASLSALLYAKKEEIRKALAMNTATLGERLILAKTHIDQKENLRWELLETIATEIHHMNHVKRDLMNSQEYQPRDLRPDATVEALIKYCESIRSLLTAIFREEGIQFQVAIKAVNSSNDPAVVCIARDRHMSTTDSHLVDNSIPQKILENTAFSLLLGKNSVVFASDDLHTLKEQHLLYNTASNWAVRYNKTMVVPIRKNAIIRPQGVFELVGFIGVSCLAPAKTRVFCEANGSPSEALKDLLLAYADSAFGIIKRGKIVGTSGLSTRNLNDYLFDESNFDFVTKLHAEFRKR